ncbi:MAG: hypothetical protein JST70_16785 [Bacteroidetes bacterium]|nr:hypothetical protein [Bacteroidota bacterium]
MKNEEEYNKAARIVDQISGLSRMLEEKGYNDFFQVNGRFTGVLISMLKEHLWPDLIFGDANSVFPLTISTITSHEEPGNSHIRCSFRLAPDKENMLHITDMEILHLKQNGDARNLKLIKVTSPDDIPTRQQANASVRPAKKKNQKHKFRM